MHFLTDGESGMLIWQDHRAAAEIIALHTLPESHGTGLGRELLSAALSQIGSRPVFLWAFAENTRARRFYEKNGFHHDGDTRVSEFDGAIEVRYANEYSPAKRNVP
jgi:ribosomal protein S18 acetylase RimI-like enzyme